MSVDVSALKRALKDSAPMLVGFVFVGMAFGLLMFSAGFNWMWSLLVSVLVYAGSLQFVLVAFLTSGASLLTVALTSFAVNCRHIFYGLTFIEDFEKFGKLKYYMIFSLTDETYSILCLAKSKGTNNLQYSFYLTALNQFYWMLGTFLGSIIGQVIPFNSKGIDFAMTAMFVVIFIEQWQDSKTKIPQLIGLTCGLLCLILIGANNFILPTLALASAFLIFFRRKVENA